MNAANHAGNFLSRFRGTFCQLTHLIHQAKKAAHIPIIASLNGVTDGAWIDYARRIQQAGADALELNIYYVPADPKISAEQVERRYIDALFHVKRTVTIPVAVKLSPYFSAMGNMAKRLSDSGANALVLFNRFYQPDFDLDNYEVVPHLVLSDSDDIRRLDAATYQLDDRSAGAPTVFQLVG